MGRGWISAILSSGLCILFFGCQSNPKNKALNQPSSVYVIGALKYVMQKGELQGRIDLDTVSNRKGLYGLGPEAFLTGELLIYDGISYVSRVQPDSSITVDKTYDLSAPFFIYANIDDWDATDLPPEVRTLAELEQYLDQLASNREHPFAYKLSGTAKRAIFHIQNLPEGTAVSSPQEAHQGQVNYELLQEDVEILGFFSRAHQGIFTHHDSYVHMHLISKDELKMGHLDELEIGRMKLFLPVK